MSDTLYVAGDLSGIQDYVLSVSTAGGGQARRLRARSFYVQVIEEIASRIVAKEFGIRWEEAVVLQGGGQFLLRLPASAQMEQRLQEVRERLEPELYRETRAELALTLASGCSLEEVLSRKEREKRRLWASRMTANDHWDASALSQEPLGASPCKICGRQAATHTQWDDEEEIRVCARCYDDTQIGKLLPTASSLELCSSGGDFQVLGRGLRFNPSTPAAGVQPLHAPRLHVPADATFKDIAEKAQGDNLLAVFKADVDSMGAKLGEMQRRDPSLASLRSFSRDLDNFFSRQVQGKLHSGAWQWVYTIYSGGDDLLLVGPWNVMLDFAEEVHRDFMAGPGNRYGLTLSAGIALTNYRVPIRHGVEQADLLLDCAKGRAQPPETRGNTPNSRAGGAPEPPKDRCAALGWVWKWERHSAILNQAKQIKQWIDDGVCPRTMIHRLLSLANRQDPLRSAHWAYEVGRNFPKASAPSPKSREFRAWGETVLAEILENTGATRELAVELRYALIASRLRRENS
ncbi:MAG: Cas10/Cmr2 second palm domain-containing protein [Terriglobia bacterium]